MRSLNRGAMRMACSGVNAELSSLGSVASALRLLGDVKKIQAREETCPFPGAVRSRAYLKFSGRPAVTTDSGGRAHSFVVTVVYPGQTETGEKLSDSHCYMTGVLWRRCQVPTTTGMATGRPIPKQHVAAEMTKEALYADESVFAVVAVEFKKHARKHLCFRHSLQKSTALHRGPLS